MTTTEEPFLLFLPYIWTLASGLVEQGLNLTPMFSRVYAEIHCVLVGGMQHPFGVLQARVLVWLGNRSNPRMPVLKRMTSDD
jgi:hypothetical protein